MTCDDEKQKEKKGGEEMRRRGRVDHALAEERGREKLERERENS